MPNYYFEINSIQGTLHTLELQDGKCVGTIIDSDGKIVHFWANITLYDALNSAIGKSIYATIVTRYNNDAGKIDDVQIVKTFIK